MKITIKEASRLIADTINQHPIAGCPVHEVKPDSYHCITYRRLHAWGLECSLTVQVQTPKHIVPIRVTVGWSSTERSPAMAVAALALYREVTELAALLEAAFVGHTIE